MLTRTRLLNGVAAAGGAGGALIMATGSTTQFGYAFILFLISSVCSMFLHLRYSDQRGLLALDIFYTCINIYGIHRWMM